MADIIFRYVEMREAADAIEEIAGRYKTAADSLQTEFAAATSSWEGESHDQMLKFMNGPVADYTGQSVPQLVKALAELLRANADQMEQVDKQIAENIPTSLG